VIGDPESIGEPKAGSENCARKNAGPEKRPPFKEVWWGDLNELGKNAAISEALLIETRERSLEEWMEVARIATGFVRISSAGWVWGNKILWQAEAGRDGKTWGTEAWEALGIAAILDRGITVHLEKRPLSAQAGASTEPSSGPRGATGPTLEEAERPDEDLNGKMVPGPMVWLKKGGVVQ
jgi:hypothetical protein